MSEIGLEGAKELEKVLSQLPAKMQKTAVTNALRAGARLIANDMKARVAVDKGDLRDAIAVRAAPKRSQRRKLVQIGIKKPVSRRAHLTEFGTVHSKAQPFMRPAVDTRGREAIKVIGRKLGKEIERLAKRLAKSSFKKIRRSI